MSGERVEKEVQKHVFEHSVDWGHVALGLAGIAVAVVIYQVLVAEPEPENDEGRV